MATVHVLGFPFGETTSEWEHCAATGRTMTSMFQKTLDQKVWPKLRREGKCLIWTGARTGSGYGHLLVEGKFVQAHRTVYEMIVGPIPAGLDLDHLCRNRLCCEVAHLEPVTRRENLRRGPTVVAANLAKTHCPQGHEFIDDNIRWVPQKSGNPSRACRTCAKDQDRNYYLRTGREKRRAARPAAIPRTHCRRGHEFTPDNTYWPPQGGRACRACARAKGREWMRAYRAIGR